MEDFSALKKALFEACLAQIDERITRINTSLANIKDSMHNETKSSVGDKYETGRAMLQLEEEKARGQLAQANRSKQEILKAQHVQNLGQVAHGSLVVTDKGIYYYITGIGQLKYEGQAYFCVSIGSPIGKMMKDKEAGEQVTFNGNTISIKSIF